MEMFFLKDRVVVAVLLFFLMPAVQALADAELNRQVHALADKLAATAKASVVKGSESEVYIAIGQKDGVLPGNRFEVVRLGEPLKVGDEIIGYEETPVAKVEATRVRDRVTICKILEKQDVPQAGDKAHQLRKTINSLVVGQFSCNQSFNRLTKSLQDKLVTAMASKGMQVVERDQLERVLKEQKLGYSGLVNSSSAKKIGQLLGADGMMLGTVNDMGNSITINARLVDLETGKTVRAAEVELPKTPMIASLLAKKVAGDPFGRGAAPASGTTAIVNASGAAKKDRKSAGKPIVQEVDGFTFALQKCKKTGANVVCDFIVTNNDNDRNLQINNASNLFDNFGNKYNADQIQLANCHNTYSCTMRLIQSIPTRAVLSFSEVSSDATNAALLEIKFWTSKWFSVQFRNISFTK